MPHPMPLEKQINRLHERRVELQHDLQGTTPLKQLLVKYRVQSAGMTAYLRETYGPGYYLERKRRLLRAAQAKNAARKANRPKLSEDRPLLPAGALSSEDQAKLAEYRVRGKTWLFVVQALNLVESARYLAAYAAFWSVGVRA